MALSQGFIKRKPAMKLFYAPGTCSLACHIALFEVGKPFSIEKVDLRSKITEAGADFRSVNPKGAVPALEIAPGEVLTEGTAIMQYLADSNGGAGIVAASGSLERARMVEAMHFIGAELHKAYSPMFNPAISAEQRAVQVGLVGQKLAWLETRLADGRAYLTGTHYSLADGYLFTISNWSKGMGIEMDAYPHLTALRARVAARPAVIAAMTAEGLM